MVTKQEQRAVYAALAMGLIIGMLIGSTFDTQLWSRSGSREYLMETGTLIEDSDMNYYISGQYEYSPTKGHYRHLNERQLKAIGRLESTTYSIVILQEFPEGHSNPIEEPKFD